MKYLGNAFSASMLAGNAMVRFSFISRTQARAWVREGVLVSVVGHAPTADMLAGMLDIPIGVQRVSIILRPGDQLLIAQYSGPRLQEGVTALPEGAGITWILVDLVEVV